MRAWAPGYWRAMHWREFCAYVADAVDDDREAEGKPRRDGNDGFGQVPDADVLRLLPTMEEGT